MATRVLADEVVTPHMPTIAEQIGDPYLYRIAICESGLKQFWPDGTPKISPTGDVGILQIHIEAWGATAKKMGLDIYNSTTSNIEMAKYVLKVQGYTAWTCSKKV